MQAVAASQGNIAGNAGLSSKQVQPPGMPMSQSQEVPIGQRPRDPVPAGFAHDNLLLPKNHFQSKFHLQLPDGLRTWRDLKLALAQNPGMIMPDALRAQVMITQQAQVEQLTKNGKLPAMPTPDSQQPHISTVIQALIAQGQLESDNGAIRMKEPTDQDILAYRAKAGAQLQQYNDEGMRSFILDHRKRQIQHRYQHHWPLIEGILAPPAGMLPNTAGMQPNAVRQPQNLPNGQPSNAISNATRQLQVPGGGMPALLTPGIPGVIGNQLRNPASSPAPNLAQPNGFDLKMPSQVTTQIPGRGEVPSGLSAEEQDKWFKMAPAQRAQMIKQMRLGRMKQAPIQLPPSTTAAPKNAQPTQPMTDVEKQQRFTQLTQEALTSTHLGLPLPIPADVKENLIKQFTRGLQIARMVETAMRAYYFHRPDHENIVRDMIRNV